MVTNNEGIWGVRGEELKESDDYLTKDRIHVTKHFKVVIYSSKRQGVILVLAACQKPGRL